MIITIKKNWLRLLAFPLLLTFASAIPAQEVRCTSNRAQIESQISSVSKSFEDRIQSVKSERSSKNLAAVAAYGAGRSWPIQQENNRKYGSVISDLELQKELSVAGLKSRIIEVCEEQQLPEQPARNQGNVDNKIQRGATLVDTLSQLAEMHKSGILTDEEFQAAKRRALGL